MLKRLKIWQKLLLIVLVMATGIPVIFYLISTRDAATIDFGQAERYGVEYLVPVRSLLQHALHLRDLVRAVRGGNEAMRAEIAPLLPAIAQDLATLAAVHARLGSRMPNNPQKTDELLAKLQRDWTELERRPVQTPPAEKADGAHEQFVLDIVALITQIGDSSNLILDPDIDSYYLMAAVIYQLPPLAVDLGALRSLGHNIALRDAATLDERLALASLAGRVQLNAEAVRAGMEESAYGINPALEKEIGPALRSALAAIGAFQDQIGAGLMRAETAAVEPTRIFATGTDTLQPVWRLYDVQLASLDRLLAARIERFRADKVWVLGVVSVGVLLAMLLSALIARAIVRQIASINDTFAQISLGDYKARARELSRDELGQMAVALNAMLDKTVTLIQSQEERDRVQRSIYKLLEEVSGVASGDLTVEAEATSDLTGQIADSFNMMLRELRQIIGSVKDAVLQLSSAANEIQTTSDHLTRGSENQAEQIVDTSAALDEMAVSIQQVSENAGLSATVAQQSLDNARQGAEAVRKTIEGMNSIRDQVRETAKRIKRLGESSQEIGEIIQLIGDIADRTSILALNASIQAAMAGDAGRGFAVVAEEVERLAVRSTEAAKRIATLVKTIQTETGEAVTAMEDTTSEVVQGSRLANEADRALEQIDAVSNRLAELIQSISLASKQQARGSEALAKSMGEISEITQQSVAATKQAAVAIANLSLLADELRESVSRFKLPASGRV